MTNVLVTMARLTPKAYQTTLKNNNLPSVDITGFIPMSSPKALGSLALSFSEKVILHIAEKILGETFSCVNDEIADLVGELTNMVTGGAKAILEDKGFDFDMSTPTVIRGRGQQISHVGMTGSVIIIPFSTEVGDFYVEICFKNR